jgi:hypothetical protein
VVAVVEQARLDGRCYGVTRSKLIALSALLCAVACGKKPEHSGPPPEVTGLAAVPATAEVVIGADVGKLSSSPIVERAIEQLLSRDAGLAANWKQVREGCKIDVAKQIKHVMFALGPVPAGGRVGTGPAIMIATGSIPEADLSDCVTKFVGKGGGSVTGKPIAGRTVYQVKDGARTMFFAFGRADTVVLGNSEAYVIEAIGAGKKALDNVELAAWLKLVDQHSPVWWVGRVDDRVRKGLVSVLPGLKSGPTAIVGTIDPTTGAKVTVGAVMASSEDASQAESFTNTQKGLIAMAAQKVSLAQVISKVTITSKGSVVYIRAPLEMTDVNQLLSVLDGKDSAKQDSAPSTPDVGSGSQK